MLHEQAGAFSLIDLIVLIAVLGVLALVPLTASGNAKGKSRQLLCSDNLRQMGVALNLYSADYRVYPGCIWMPSSYYVWPTRLLPYAGNRGVFHCPAAAPNSAWDPKVNLVSGSTTISTLGGVNPEGIYDPYGVTSTSRFSYGYNDWGFKDFSNLGLGGDINNPKFLVSPVAVIVPSQMIAIADVQALRTGMMFSANLDVTDDSLTHAQRPSNRHEYRSNLLFVDGHVESPFRNDVINPSSSNWRRRWNNDNQPHQEVIWSVNPNSMSRLDP